MHYAPFQKNETLLIPSKSRILGCYCFCVRARSDYLWYLGLCNKDSTCKIGYLLREGRWCHTRPYIRCLNVLLNKKYSTEKDARVGCEEKKSTFESSSIFLSQQSPLRSERWFFSQLSRVFSERAVNILLRRTILNYDIRTLWFDLAAEQTYLLPSNLSFLPSPTLHCEKENQIGENLNVNS